MLAVTSTRDVKRDGTSLVDASSMLPKYNDYLSIDISRNSVIEILQMEFWDWLTSSHMHVYLRGRTLNDTSIDLVAMFCKVWV